MSILSSYIRELEFSRRKDTGKMVLKEYLPPVHSLYFLISVLVQVVGHFGFRYSCVSIISSLIR